MCILCDRARKKFWVRTVNGRLANVQQRARSKGLGFDLTEETYTKLLEQPCRYCGGPLPESMAGLDRVDSNRGYELDNVVPCCQRCNMVKADYFTYEEMLRLGALIRTIKEERKAVASKPMT